MALDWETFKSNLGLSSNTSVFYIDEEGSKIPIDSQCEFQEALRLARLNKNNLKFIFCGDKLKPREIMCVDNCQPVQSVPNPKEKSSTVKVKNESAMPQNNSSRENTCNCHGDSAPEWFTHYMKKFKKEIVHELKSYVHDTVHSAISKKLSCYKSEIGELLNEKNENAVSSGSTHSKKKKKSSERDLMDLIDQRQIRPPKKLNATKPERLEMLDQKTKALLEEKRRLLESKHHSKSKPDTNSPLTPTAGVLKKSKNSASFPENNLCFTLPRESEFKVTVNIRNDGALRWGSSELVCFESKGVSINFWDYRKKLQKLNPRESCSVELRGKLLPEESPRYFKCRVVESLLIPISPEFVCRFEVIPETDLAKESEEMASQLREIGSLIDFEKDLIASSQKKIEENISEIERRLHDIDLLQPSVSGKVNLTYQKGSDLIELESKLMEEEEKNSRVGETSGMCNMENGNEKGMNEKEDSNKRKDDELDTSDSELSIVFMSEEEIVEEFEEEEEENFFLVRSVIESMSTGESANEEKTAPNVETKGKPATEQPKTAATEAKTARGTSKEEETFQQSPTRCRCSPFGEEISKPKKMKSKSTEYRFTAANLTQPTIPGFYEGRPSRFTFTGEKEGGMKNGIPVTDELRRVIYAVNSSGRCFPIKDVLDGKCEPSPRQSQKRQKKRHDSGSDTPAVNTLPNALINGASNVASFAFNTAKSVITNLQSAFVTEGKTEMGTPAYEDRVKPCMQAMSLLCDMGYMDVERNQRLLILHNNNVNSVLDELFRTNEHPSERSF